MKNTTRVMAQLQRILNDIKERESVALNGEIPPFGEYISERDLRDAWEADAVSKATFERGLAYYREAKKELELKGKDLTCLKGIVMTAMESVRYLDDELAEERGTK